MDGKKTVIDWDRCFVKYCNVHQFWWNQHGASHQKLLNSSKLDYSQVSTLLSVFQDVAHSNPYLVHSYNGILDKTVDSHKTTFFANLYNTFLDVWANNSRRAVQAFQRDELPILLKGYLEQRVDTGSGSLYQKHIAVQKKVIAYSESTIVLSRITEWLAFSFVFNHHAHLLAKSSQIDTGNGPQEASLTLLEQEPKNGKPKKQRKPHEGRKLRDAKIVKYVNKLQKMNGLAAAMKSAATKFKIGERTVTRALTGQ